MEWRKELEGGGRKGGEGGVRKDDNSADGVLLNDFCWRSCAGSQMPP